MGPLLFVMRANYLYSLCNLFQLIADNSFLLFIIMFTTETTEAAEERKRPGEKAETAISYCSISKFWSCIVSVDSDIAGT